MEDHSDQGPLIAALDEWFAILRKRTGGRVPLKPATRSDLDRLSQALRLDLPPDVVALYEYSNGAWLDGDTPVHGFVPSRGGFPQIPDRRSRKRIYSMTMELEDDHSGFGFADWPASVWRNEVPVFGFDTGDQISVMGDQACYQKVALLGLEGFRFVASGLAEFIGNAVELERRGLLDWPNGVPYIAYDRWGLHYPTYPFNPDKDHNGNPWKRTQPEGTS